MTDCNIIFGINYVVALYSSLVRLFILINILTKLLLKMIEVLGVEYTK